MSAIALSTIYIHRVPSPLQSKQQSALLLVPDIGNMVFLKGALVLLSSFFVVIAVVVSHDEALMEQAVDVKLAVSAPPAAAALPKTPYAAPPPSPYEVSPSPALAPAPAIIAPTPPLVDAPFPEPPVDGTPTPPFPAFSSPPFTVLPPHPVLPRPIGTPKKCVPLCLMKCNWRLKKRACMRACMTCCDRCRCVPPGNREMCGNCCIGSKICKFP